MPHDPPHNSDQSFEPDKRTTDDRQPIDNAEQAPPDYEVRLL